MELFLDKDLGNSIGRHCAGYSPGELVRPVVRPLNAIEAIEYPEHPLDASSARTPPLVTAVTTLTMFGVSV